MPGVRICVIGAGIGGLSFMHQLERYRELEDPEWNPEVVCYEKQVEAFGMWNFTWRTGIGEGEENVHGSMYRHLWINGPKENHEFSDYTFEKHFGKALPSYLPREVMLDYLKGRFSQYNLIDQIKFHRVVSNVQFDESSQKFHIFTRDITPGNYIETTQMELPEKSFDYIVNCTGHYSVPDAPSLKGISTFPGRILHSHDFRNPSEFSGQDILIVGSYKSAEDLSMLVLKFGARSVIVSGRSGRTGIKWPKEITEKSQVAEIQESRVTFEDGSSASLIHSIIFCTGYLHHYPHLPPDLRLIGPNSFYPEGLYKGIVWMGHDTNVSCNGRMLYIGSPKEFAPIPMCSVQALWAVKWVRGLLNVSKEEMERDVMKWRKDKYSLKTSNLGDSFLFHTNYLKDIGEESGYGLQYGGDGSNFGNIESFTSYMGSFFDDILGYRDKCYKSKYTGTMAAEPKVKYMDFTKEISVEEFLEMY